MPSLFQVKTFIRHWLYETDDHSIHSPFFFDLYSRIVKKSNKSDLPVLENLRYDMESNKTVLDVTDFGAGSQNKSLATSKRAIGDIARTSSTPYQVAMFYSDLIYYIKAKRVVELGTSLGITTLYLAQRKDSSIYTFEGSHDIANIALTNFEWAGKKNIELIEGNIDSTLPRFLESTAKIDFALMDANHRYSPTLRYYQLLTKRLYEKSILIIDDIHRSPEMEKAWKEIKSDTLVYGSIDLYRCGVLFFDPVLRKQHFIWSLK